MIGLDRVWHAGIVCRNLDVSLPFYEALGFKVLERLDIEDPLAEIVSRGMGARFRKSRGVLMRLENEPNGLLIDLVECSDPAPKNEPYENVLQVGICRIAFAVSDIRKTYAALQKMGVEFVGPLMEVDYPSGGKASFVMFKDPDGIVLELVGGVALNVGGR